MVKLFTGLFWLFNYLASVWIYMICLALTRHCIIFLDVKEDWVKYLIYLGSICFWIKFLDLFDSISKLDEKLDKNKSSIVEEFRERTLRLYHMLNKN